MENTLYIISFLGVKTFIGETSFRIKTGYIPAKQTTDVDCGDGLLFIGAFSGGALFWPTYWSTSIDKIAGDIDYVTLTKEAASRKVSINNDQIYSYSWVYLGFY